MRTTWREIIDAAATVGRDPTGWLAAVPSLAWAEFVARRSPLMAYLGRSFHADGPTGSVYHLEPNVVYQHGTESSTQVGFGYWMGMTMAEWACRGLLGTGPTDHAESILPPVQAGPEWMRELGLPDLVARRPGSAHPWLIEAKGGRRAGLSMPRKGAEQLTRPGLMSGPHVRVLCGTSLEHRVFVTLDVETADIGGNTIAPDPPPAPGPVEEDSDAILDLARSRLLFYLALRALPPERLRITPIGRDVSSYRSGRSVALAQLLEHDPSTAAERAAARQPAQYRRRPPELRTDMITGRVPGTDLIVGLSRRLYAACEQLAGLEASLAQTVDVDQPVLLRNLGPEPDLRDVDEQRRERAALFRSREREERPYLRERTRAGFERGAEAEWPELVGSEPPVVTEPPAGYLEAATTDAYIAVSTATTTTAR